MKNHLNHFLFFLFFACISCLLNAQNQCTVHGIDGGEDPAFQTSAQAGYIVGQSFEACQTGNITSISITAASDAIPGTQSLRLGASTNPPTALLGTAVYQTFTNNGGEETIIINLNTPFPVTNGNTYAFEVEFDTGFDMSLDSGDDYSGGISYTDFGGGFESFGGVVDLDFEVVISTAVDVPTISQWGLIILALILLILGTLHLILTPKNRTASNS